MYINTGVEREINADSPPPSSRSRRSLPRLGRQNITPTALGQYSPYLQFKLRGRWPKTHLPMHREALGGHLGGDRKASDRRRYGTVERMMVFRCLVVCVPSGR